MYFFKINDSFVLGQTTASYYPAGGCVLRPNADKTTISINNVFTKEAVIDNVKVTNILKENGTAYTDFTELLTAVESFFVKASGGGGTLDYSTDIEADKTNETKVVPPKTLYDWAEAKYTTKLITYQTHTSGATVTLDYTINCLLINPATVLNALTITTPLTANLYDGQTFIIDCGGTITSGYVVTNLILTANTGQTIKSGGDITSLLFGETFTLRWIASTSTWSINT